VILVDAGPLVALVDSDDQHHQKCVTALRQIKEPLATVWPALTEALYLLNDLPAGQEAVWDSILRGVIGILPLDVEDIPRIRELMRKYRDRGMELADAALIRTAERENVRKFFTVDRSDFAVYRFHGRVRPVIVP
jgi:predicted nucleic acid-binding protein